MSHNPHFRSQSDQQDESESSASVALLDSPAPAHSPRPTKRPFAGPGGSPAASLHDSQDVMENQSSSWALGATRDGMYKLLAGVGLVGAGALLLSNITSAPALALQTGLLGGIGVIVGLAVAVVGFRHLTMRLEADASGISLKPSPLGFSIAWSDLRCWGLTDIGDRGAGFSELKLWKQGVERPFLVDITELHAAERCQLRRTLIERAPDDEE